MRYAITFDDVLLVPSYNHYESRKVVDIAMTDKTTKLHLKLPLMTANMDTISGKAIQVKSYRGMASREAQEDFQGGMAEWKTSEGISLEIPYRETEDEIIADIIGGLRSGLTYGGASNIRELQRKLDYIQISLAGRAEGLAHALRF